MIRFFPLEFYISNVEAIGFFMFAPAILFFIVGIVLLLAKRRKPGKVFLIISGCCLLIAIGMCGFGALL